MKDKNVHLIRPDSGFTLTELMASVAILGILSSITIPNFVDQAAKARQNESTATVSQIQTRIATYADEFGTLPTTWKELNETSAIMTSNGPANQENFDPITLAGSNYKVGIRKKDNLFTLVAIQPRSQKINREQCDRDYNTDVTFIECGELNFEKCINAFNESTNPVITNAMCGERPIAACLNLTNGASEVKKIETVDKEVLSPNCG